MWCFSFKCGSTVFQMKMLFFQPAVWEERCWLKSSQQQHVLKTKRDKTLILWKEMTNKCHYCVTLWGFVCVFGWAFGIISWEVCFVAIVDFWVSFLTCQYVTNWETQLYPTQCVSTWRAGNLTNRTFKVILCSKTTFINSNPSILQTKLNCIITRDARKCGYISMSWLYILPYCINSQKHCIDF